ncbi:hypothetical protein HYH03_012490 [Edaphochlamys debaryana]|uniref:phytol kinase n=1 Tax=Edaphochlamys debaryana TaxID=47281 RepID=A0A836BVI8_9CHLO|nr:hypothetical protein HYH03_012490 [Edaphochlamys debaryana]|eukprot:KAG2489054.1 hypothetical protein HYH03_012490 [Edaphochlamys debaryana]
MMALKPLQRGREVKDLATSLEVVTDHMSDFGERLVVLESIASRPHLSAALVRLVAVAVREDVTDESEQMIGVGSAALEVAAIMVEAANAEAFPAAQDAAAALAGAFLKTQLLHAATRQAAAVATALLAPPSTQAAAGHGGRASTSAGPGPSAAAGAKLSSAACAAAVQVAGNVTRLVAAVAKFSCGRRDKALAKALVSALVKSHVLDHIGRLLLAVGQGPVGQAPPQPLARLQETAFFRLSGAMHEVMAVSSVSYLLAMPLNRGEAQPYPCVSGVVIEALLTSLLMDQEAPHPTVPRRAAIRLLLRVLRLASASVRATSQGTSRGPGRMVRVDVGGMGGRQVETQEYRALLAPKSSGLVAIQAMNLLARAARIESQAWVAEAGPAWALLFASVRHAMPALGVEHQVSRLALEASARMLVKGEPGASKPSPHVGFQRSLTAVSNLVGYAYAGLVSGATTAAPVATHRLAVACSLPFLVEDAGLGRLIGVLLALVSRFETIPSLQPARACLTLARWCTLPHAAYPDRQWRSDGGGPSGGGAGGSSSGGGVCLWEPGALYWVAAEVGRTEPQLCSKVTALAAWLERVLGREAPKEGPLPPGIALLAERLAALKAEARALLPACANPACANLAGDSEAGLRLQRCAGCQAVSYCCKECQTAHWRAGHKAACGGKTG